MLTVVVVIAAVWYLAWVTKRATRRNAAGMCGRCGKPLTAGGGHEQAGLTVCDACVALAARNHRAAFWFLIAVAPLATLAIAMGLRSDISSGFGVGPEYVPAFFLAITVPLGLAFALRRATASQDRQDK